MMYPIARVMKSPKAREGILFYDTASRTTKYYKLADIRKEAHGKFAGVAVTNSIRMTKYFQNIGTIGDKANPGKADSYTLCQRIITKDEVKYLLVDTIGNTAILNKDELICIVFSGVPVYGMELMPNNILHISHAVETVVDPEISSEKK